MKEITPTNPDSYKNVMEKHNFNVVFPSPDKWQELKAIRLEALEKVPEAYSALLEKELAQSEEEWRKILETNDTQLAAFVEDNNHPIGMARAEKIYQDVWMLRAVYLRKEMRGNGLSEKLIY